YLYDDFAFYRGLVKELAVWSAASCQVPGIGPAEEYGLSAYRNLELSNAGSSMVRWALAIRPGRTWQDTEVERRKDGFSLLAWNGKLHTKPTVKVAAKEAGLKAEADVLQVQVNEPAFRLPAKFDVSWAADKIAVKVSRPARIRLDYGVLRP